MISVNYKKILSNELQGLVLSELDTKILINNNEVKTYLYLLSNIKNKIHNGYYISDVEWKFYIDKLLLLNDWKFWNKLLKLLVSNELVPLFIFKFEKS